MATPRNLDPKFKDEKDMPKEEETTESVPDWDGQEKQEETMIVHRQPVYRPDGTTEVIEHGPMPRSEWPAYEREHEL